MALPPVRPDMQKHIDIFYAGADEVVTDFARALEAQPVPTMLYHYTDGAGLSGMLESGKVWLTDIFSLNDPSELRHGVASVIRQLKEAADTGPQELKIFTKNLIAMLEGGIEEIAHFFVCCFSVAANDLGQWRAYADNGRGFALGFDGKMIEDAFTKTGAGPIEGRMTFPVTYADAPLDALHRQIVEALVPMVSLPHGKHMRNREIDAYMSELSVNASVPILRGALFFKHAAYVNEAEYRFLDLHRAGAVPDLKTRGKPGAPKRYREFDWRTVAPNALKSITIGPAADPAAARQFIDECRRAFHPAPDLEILESGIPYRAP
jgi:hypothetical protein